MENSVLGIRCRIVAQIPTGIHRFDGNSHKIRSDPSRSGRRIKSPGSGGISVASTQKGFTSDKTVKGFFSFQRKKYR